MFHRHSGQYHEKSLRSDNSLYDELLIETQPAYHNCHKGEPFGSISQVSYGYLIGPGFGETSPHNNENTQLRVPCR